MSHAVESGGDKNSIDQTFDQGLSIVFHEGMEVPLSESVDEGAEVILNVLPFTAAAEGDKPAPAAGADHGHGH